MSAQRQLQSVNVERLRGAMREWLIQHYIGLGHKEGIARMMVAPKSDADVQALIEKRYEGGLEGFIQKHMTLRVVT